MGLDSQDSHPVSDAGSGSVSQTVVPRHRFPGWHQVRAVTFALFGTAGVICLLLWLAGVFHPKVPDVTSEFKPDHVSDLPQVEVRVLTRPRYESAVGTIKPIHESAVASKLLARVTEVNLKAGQAVSAGDVLVRLDDADLQSRLKQAEAAQSGALARRQQATADFDRAKPLFAKSAISKAEYDQTLAAMRTAAAEADRANQSIREAKILLAHATIRAPLTGIIVDKRIETGDTVSPGQVLVALYDPARMQMVASVRESLAMRLAVGQKLSARLESLGYECEATVSEVVPEAAAGSRSFAVKVVGPCPEGAYSGMFGRLLLPLEDEDVVVVPVGTVRRVGQLTMLDVVSDGALRRRHVQLGRTFDDEVEVLSGVKPGEKVILRESERAR